MLIAIFCVVVEVEEVLTAVYVISFSTECSKYGLFAVLILLHANF